MTMIKALHVDDDAGRSRTVRQSLLAYGIEVRSESDPAAAIGHLEKGDIEVLISGHSASGTNGLELLRNVREKGVVIPFVIFASDGDDDVARHAMDLGADLFIRDGEGRTRELAQAVVLCLERRRAMDDLSQSEGRYHRLTENLPAVVAKVPLVPGDRPYISPGIKNVLGYSQQEVMKDPEKYLNGDLRKEFDRMMSSVHKGEDIDPIVHVTIANKKGELRWIEQRQVLVRDEDGVPIALESIAYDVTDAKNLADRNELLSSIISNSPNEIYLLNYDTYRCEFANRKAMDDHGWTAESDVELSSIFGEDFTKEDMDGLVDDLRSGMKDVVTSSGEHRHKGGDGYPVEVHVQISEDHGERKFLVTAFSIDRVKRIEKELQRTERLFRTYMDLTPASIIVLDGSGNIAYVNEAVARILGMTREEVLSLKADDLISKIADGNHYHSSFVFDAKGYASSEIELKTTEGVKHLIVSASKVDDAYIGFGVDITDLKKVQHDLQRMIEKSRLLGSITRHDIMNQVTIIRGNIELMTYAGAMPERTKGMTNAIEKIGQYVRFAESLSQAGLNEPRWFDVKEVASRSWQTIGSKDVEFNADLEGIEVRADPMLPKVFDNLIMNSVVYGTGMSRVGLSAERCDEDLVLIYTDDGPGIPEDLRPRLFSKGAGRNTGLGLFLIRQILQETDIGIVERGQGGKGVRFEMVVPAGHWRQRGV